MIGKCAVALRYEAYPKPLSLGLTDDPFLLVLVKRALLKEATETLEGVKVVGDDVLIQTYQNDLDTLRKILDLLIPPEAEAICLAGGSICH